MPPDSSAGKRKVIEYIRAGLTVADAMDRVGRHPKSYDYWRKTDPDFAEAVGIARELKEARRNGEAREVPEFDEFCSKYLHQPLHYHQLQWWDMLEGNPPRDLHESMTYVQGDPDRILINTPVHHAKTITLTVNYVTWRICKDPSVRVLMVSKTREMAKEFLLAIKSRLTHPEYKELQLAFSPEGGWKATADVWSADKIYVGAEDRKGGEKDPTVQALGIQGHIYGARADLIILDDTIVGANAHEFEKQISWLEREVETRLTASGKMLVVGTRIASLDLYSELQNSERYTDGECPWTVLTQPAVLEFAEDPANWKTLWPAAQVPCDCRQFCNKGDLEPDENGRYPKWDGLHLNKIRRAKSPATWSMVYMQQQVTDDAVFPVAAVREAIDGQRQPGPMYPGAVGHRQHGMEGLYVVAGLDPAMTENTAAVVMGVDRATKERWVLDVFDRKAVTPSGMRDLIKMWTEKYNIHEWRVEKNAFQIFLTQDQEINQYLASRGCLLREHYCVDDETQVLSTRGWVGHDQLAIGDTILTLNTATGLSEWMPVKDKYVGAYSGPMHRVKGRFIDALTTPDHSWPVHMQDRTELTLKQSQHLTTGDWTPLARPVTPTDRTFYNYSDDEVRLIGWAVTEGHFRKVGTSIQIGQSQTANPEYVDAIRKVLANLGADWCERDNGSGTTVFSLKGDYARLVRNATDNGKNLPATLVMDLTPDQRDILVDVVVNADGWRQGNNLNLCSDSPSILEGFEMLCALQGHATGRTYSKGDPGHGTVCRRISRASRVQANTEEIEWTGTVWCPSTDNGTFYAKRGGVTYFTGNTGRNKWDADFGVASMSMMFGNVTKETTGRGGYIETVEGGLIHLPSTKESEACKRMVEQFITWAPETKNKTDIVMATWFAELRAREIANFGGGVTHLPNKYLGSRAMQGRTVVNLDVLFQEQQSGQFV